jgi:hypothetical protein
MFVFDLATNGKTILRTKQATEQSDSGNESATYSGIDCIEYCTTKLKLSGTRMHAECFCQSFPPSQYMEIENLIAQGIT